MEVEPTVPLALTNLSTYRAIVADTYTEMRRASEAGRTRRSDNKGWILKFDPEQTSFKNAMILMVFAGIWLEALLHLLIVRDHGEAKYSQFDFKSYEDKLRLIGISDEELLARVKRFRETRKELVHEKAHFEQGEIKVAQSEAEAVYALVLELEHQIDVAD